MQACATLRHAQVTPARGDRPLTDQSCPTAWVRRDTRSIPAAPPSVALRGPGPRARVADHGFSILAVADPRDCVLARCADADMAPRGRTLVHRRDGCPSGR